MRSHESLQCKFKRDLGDNLNHSTLRHDRTHLNTLPAFARSRPPQLLVRRNREWPTADCHLTTAATTSIIR